MSREEIYNRLSAFLHENFQIEHVDIESKFKEDFDLDSLDYLSILIFLEEEFKISISEDQYLKLNTIDELLNYVQICIRSN